MNQNLSNFFLCGSAGWCLEILWTGLHSLLAGQRTMNGKTSLLMFPIYGCAAVIAPLYARIYTFPFFCRGAEDHRAVGRVHLARDKSARADDAVVADDSAV